MQTFVLQALELDQALEKISLTSGTVYIQVTAHGHHSSYNISNCSGADLKQIFIFFGFWVFFFTLLIFPLREQQRTKQQRTQTEQSVLIHFPGEKIIGLLALL